MEITTIFKNYGKFEDLNITGKYNHILLISGPNDGGKTTIKTVFKEAVNIKALKKQPLKEGELSGFTEVHILDKDGNTVIVKHDFNKFDSKGDFYLTSHEGKSIKARPKMVELLGHSVPLSVPELFSMLNTVEGRKSFIKNFIYPAIPSDVLEKIKLIDIDINTSNGVLYLDRRATTNLLKEQELNLNTCAVSAEDEKKITLHNAAVERLASLKKETEDRQEIINSNVDTNIAISNLQSNHMISSSRINSYSENLSESIKKETDEIDELRAKIIIFETNIREYNNRLERYEVELEEQEVAFKKEEALLTKKLTLIPEVNEVDTDAITNGERFIKEVEMILDNQKDYLIRKQQVTETEIKLDKLNKELEDARKERVELFNQANLPKGLMVDTETGMIKYNGLDFTETEISESKALLTIAELKCSIDKSFMIDMGKFDAYGEGKLKELYALAKKHNKLVLLEEVTADNTEIVFKNIIVE